MGSNTLFRFRPYSVLTLKELLYSEVYFAYESELNDPMDLVVDLIIPQKKAKILSFFLRAALRANDPKKRDQPAYDKIADSIPKFFGDREINLRDFVQFDFREYFKPYYVEHLKSDYNFDRFYSYFRNSIRNLYPENLMSLSFCGNASNPVLWSIYANNHKGICLVFEVQNSMLALKKRDDEDYREHRVHDVAYDNNKTVDVSKMFSEDLEDSVDKNFEEFFEQLRIKTALTKYRYWSQENEKRVTGGFGVTFSHLNKKTKIETISSRTYHFRKDQLKGIILGVRLSEKERREVEDAYMDSYDKYQIFDAVYDNGNIGAQLRIDGSLGAGT